jgi:hypothetical protein
MVYFGEPVKMVKRPLSGGPAALATNTPSTPFAPASCFQLRPKRRIRAVNHFAFDFLAAVRGQAKPNSRADRGAPLAYSHEFAPSVYSDDEPDHHQGGKA